MPRVTLFFKGKVISSHHLDSDEVIIGRNAECTLAIDSLAVAERHLAIRKNGDSYNISALDSEFPVLLNHVQVDSATLTHGDQLKIGKHTLDFIDDGVPIATPNFVQEEAASPEQDEPSDHQGNDEIELTGILQIQSGSNIGRVIPLNRSLIRIGKSGEECAVIAHRVDGYYLSFLDGSRPPKVNQTSIGEHSHHLLDGDQIEIGGTLMHFQKG